MKTTLTAALLLATLAGAKPEDFGHTPAQFRQRDVDPEFRCELTQDDYDGFRPFRFLVGVQRRCAVRQPGMPHLPCLFEAYWLDGKTRGPMAIEDHLRLRERCGFAVRAERTEWPLHTLHDSAPGSYIALHVMCHGEEPVAIRLEGGHDEKRQERICALPDSVRHP